MLTLHTTFRIQNVHKRDYYDNECNHFKKGAQVKQSIRTIYLQFSTEQVQLKIYRIKN